MIKKPCCSRFSLRKFIHVKLFWTQFQNVHLQGPCSLWPCTISRPYCIVRILWQQKILQEFRLEKQMTSPIRKCWCYDLLYFGILVGLVTIVSGWLSDTFTISDTCLYGARNSKVKNFFQFIKWYQESFFDSNLAGQMS